MHQVTKVPEKLLSFAVRCKNLSVSNTRTVLLTPEIYINQSVYEQLLDLLLDGFQGARMSYVLCLVGNIRKVRWFLWSSSYLVSIIF